MKTTLIRNSYGELTSNHLTNELELRLLLAAKQLVKAAVQKKRLPAAYDSLTWDRKRRASGTAIHHEIYDITPTATRVMVCARETEGSKYGVRTVAKNYYLVARCGTGCAVTAVSKALAAKAAKAYADELGHGIAICLGKEKLKLPAHEIRTGYKALTVDDQGNPVSVWDASPWPIGKARIEKATDCHRGGFYYYRSINEIITAAAENDIFGNCRDHKNLIIAQVEVAGREYRHGAKLCATKIRPVAIVASILCL